MKTRFKTAALLALAILASCLSGGSRIAFAQQTEIVSFPIVSKYDFDSATATYAALGPKIDVLDRVKTSGSSKTVTAAAGAPFTNVGVGDELTIELLAGQAPIVEVVETRSSATSITVTTAIDLSGNGTTGYKFSYRDLVTGTTGGAGWFSVSGFSDARISVWIDQLAVASGNLAVTVQCKPPSPFAVGIPLYPTGAVTQCGLGQFTTAGATARCDIPITGPWAACRVGVTLTDDVDDLTTNREFVYAFFQGRRE